MTRCGVSNIDGKRVSHPNDPQKTVEENSGPPSQRSGADYKMRSLEFRVLESSVWSRSSSIKVTADIPQPSSEGSLSIEIGQPATYSAATSDCSPSTEAGRPAKHSPTATPGSPSVHHAYGPYPKARGRNIYLL